MAKPKKDNISFSYNSKKTSPRVRELVDKWTEEGETISDKLREALLTIDEQEHSNQIQLFLYYHKLVKDLMTPFYPDPKTLAEKVDVVLSQIFQPNTAMLTNFMSNPTIFVAQVEEIQRESMKANIQSATNASVATQPASVPPSTPTPEVSVVEEKVPVVTPEVKETVAVEEVITEKESVLEANQQQETDVDSDQAALLEAFNNPGENVDEEEEEDYKEQNEEKTVSPVVENQTKPRRSRKKPVNSGNLSISPDNLGDILSTLNSEQ